MRISISGLILGLILVSCCQSLGYAQQFRITSELYAGKEAEPFAESLTLFNSEGVIYDFELTGQQVITVIDPKRERIVMLDAATETKTEISMQLFAAAIVNMKSIGLKNDGRKFFFEPEFETSFDAETGTLKLAAKEMSYTAKTIRSQQSAAAASYQMFADWSARLNGIHPQNMPPFARIELNKELGARNVLPEEVKLVIPGALRTIEYKSRHAVIWNLSNTDRKKIETAGVQMATFTAVTFQEFLAKK